MARADKKRKTKPIELPPGLQAYTIPQFCLVHNISLDSYYRMQRTGDGPKIKKVGASTRITVEAAKAWREAGEAATKNAASAEADA